MMSIILFAAFAALSFGIYKVATTKNKKKELKELLAHYDALLTKLGNFTPNKLYKNNAGLCMIALDANRKQVLFARPVGNLNSAAAMSITYKIVEFNKILRSEIVVNGETVSSKSASGALVGGLLFGTAGAIVGSNAGKTKVKKEITSIKLKLLLNDLMNPTYELFFYLKGYSDVGTEQYQTDCQYWQDTFSVMLAQ